MTVSAFYLIKSSFGEVHLTENHTWIRPVVPKLQQLKDSQNNNNKRNIFLFLAVPHNQCSCFPTDPATSQHIYALHCSYTASLDLWWMSDHRSRPMVWSTKWLSLQTTTQRARCACAKMHLDLRWTVFSVATITGEYFFTYCITHYY